MSVVKEEPPESEIESDEGAELSETALYAEYPARFVKDELECGPEEVQRPSTSIIKNVQNHPSEDNNGTSQEPVLINHNGKQFIIKPCSINLRRVDNLFTNWDIKEPRHTCKMCQHSYKSRHNLTRHMRHHVKQNTDVKKLIWYDTLREIYICDFCGKVYFRKFNLIRHVQLHMHIKVYHRIKRARMLGLMLTDPTAIFVDPKTALNVVNASKSSRVQNSADPLPKSEIQFAEQLTESHAHDHPETNTEEELKSKEEIPSQALEIQSKKDVYICDTCGAWFQRKSLLVKHMQDPNSHRSRPQPDESRKPRYVCDICKEKFPSTYTLTNHLLRTHAAIRGYRCHVCQKEFAFQCLLDLHGEVHKKQRPRPFSCGLCDKKVMTKRSLSRHHKFVHNKDKSFTCDVCLNKFARKYDLICHLRTHTGDKPFACGACPRRFSHKNSLKLHVQSYHTEVKPYHCKICPKQFASKFSLTSHTRYHTDHKPFACDTCNKRFRDKTHLNSHKETHTGQKHHECKICSRRFLAKGNLTRHQLIHTKREKVHQCETCQKMFSGKDTLMRHKTIHDGTNKKLCKICNKWFAGNINTHLKVHSGEKPHPCRFCSKAFASKSHLNRHEYIHVGERPYGCSICEWRFPDKSGLAAHERIHKRDKPYCCDICRKLLKNRYSMVTHMKDHTGEIPHCCDVCGDLFAYKFNLDDHSKLHATK